MKKATVGIALLLVLVMATSLVAVAASYPNPGTSVTNAVTQNLSTEAGDDYIAHVSVDYYDTDGNPDYTHDGIIINQRAVQEIKTEDEPLGDGWAGSAVMQSDQPLGVIVSIKNTNVPGAPDGLTQGAYNATVEPATTLYFPSLYAFQYIVSRVTVQNAEDTTATVKMHYYDREGNDLGTKTVDILPFSQQTFDLGNAADVPFDPESFEDGSCTVTSETGQLLAGAAVTTWDNRAAAYQALTPTNQGTLLYAPSHYRFMSNPASGTWTLSSALNIQNTSEDTVAQVKATYVGRDDGEIYLEKEFTIEPLSAVGLNTKNGGDFPASDFNPLSYAGGGVADWDGSVKIESLNGVQLVGICNTNWDEAGNAGAYALVTDNDAADQLFFPAQYRLDWGSGWAQWSAVNVMNIGGSLISADDLVFDYIDQDGNTIITVSGSDLPFDLDVGAAVGLNTRNGGDLDPNLFTPLGLQFIGGVHVTAPDGSQLVGVANIIYNNRGSVYNAFPKP